MIKSTLNPPQAPQISPREYPYLGEYKSDDAGSFVVLFWEKGKGVVVYNNNWNDIHNPRSVGTYFDEWIESCFQPVLTGTKIILEA